MDIYHFENTNPYHLTLINQLCVVLLRCVTIDSIEWAVFYHLNHFN